MSQPGKTSRELFDGFMKLEWQDIFRTEVDVRLDTGGRYVPNSGPRGVQLLRKNVNAFDEAIRVWSGPTEDPDSGTAGYDRIVAQAGIQYTWEWFLIDPTRPWAGDVPEEVRARIRADLERRDAAALAKAEADAKEHERLALLEDDEVIGRMNAKRVDEGRQGLTPEQEAMVRQRRVDSRQRPGA
jgi:hypothetical protein